VKVEVVARGYEPAAQLVTLSQDRELEIALERRAPVPRRDAGAPAADASALPPPPPPPPPPPVDAGRPGIDLNNPFLRRDAGSTSVGRPRPLP